MTAAANQPGKSDQPGEANRPGKTNQPGKTNRPRKTNQPGESGGDRGGRAPRVLMVEEGGIGGVAEYTGELTRALGRAGCEVHLAAGRDSAFGEAPNVFLHRLFPYVRGRSWPARAVRGAGLSRAVNGVSHLGADLLLARLARACEVVHVQGEEWPPLGAAQALILRGAGRPVVYSPHNTFDRSARSYPRSHAVIRRCAARIVVHSEYDRRALSASLAAKTVVIPHGEYGGLARRGPARAEAAAVRAQLGVSGEQLLVLLFGQLRPDKGVGDLLEAAAEVREAVVVLAGEDHGALAEVRALLEDGRLHERVRVLEGFVEPQRAGELFAAADVVALPYLRASASGCCCSRTDTGARSWPTRSGACRSTWRRGARAGCASARTRRR